MHPILYQSDSIVISAFGVLLSLTYLIAGSVFILIGRKHQVSTNKLLGVLLWGYLGGLVGSRLLFVLSNLSQFQTAPWRAFSISPGGFIIYGGLVFSVLALGWYVKANQLSFWDIVDYGAVATAVGMSITKIGCYLAGCCYGQETTLGIGVQFPEFSPPAQHYGILHSVHPSQLYGSVWGLGLLVVLLWVGKRQRVAGEVCLSFFLLFSLERMFNLTQRGDIVNDLVWGIPQSQLFGAVFVVAAAATWLILRRQQRRP